MKGKRLDLRRWAHLIERDPPTMSPEEFKALLLLLGEDGEPLPRSIACHLFFVSVRTIDYWCSGEVPIPPLAVEKAQRLLRAARRGSSWRAVA